MEDLIKRDDVIKVLMRCTPFKNPHVFDEVEKRIGEIPSVDLNEVFDEWASLWFKDFELLEQRLKVHEEVILKAINALENRIKELEADRPVGEWVDTLSVNEFGEPFVIGITCSECDFFTVEPSNYCPNCGARMKGEANE